MRILAGLPVLVKKRNQGFTFSALSCLVARVTGIVVKRTEQEFSDFLATERGFMSIFGRFNEERLKFESYQSLFLDIRARFRCVEKGRQTGFSFVFAAEQVARCHLKDSQTGVFVSYNLDDAKEKINFAKQMHEELPLEYQKKIVTDSATQIAFQSNSYSKRISRIISHPSKAPRGKTGDVYLDELAHYRNDREVYKGSTALILRSKGQLTICSSPLGRRGLFWEIARQEMRNYPAYTRQLVPWWLCSFFCTDVKRAALEAPGMETEERVQKFASKSGGIRGQFDSMALEDFQEEFEVIYSDEVLSFFPYGLITKCTETELQMIEDLYMLDRCEGRLVGGFDVGRKKDVSELMILEENEKTKKKKLVYCLTLEKKPLHEQEDTLRELLMFSPLARLAIDSTGLGTQLGESLQADFPDIVEVVNFGQVNKERMANDMKISLQKSELILPADKKLVRQIHAIKKRITSFGNAIFEVDTSGNTKEIGHGDKFWALALANRRDHAMMDGTAEIGVTVI